MPANSNRPSRAALAMTLLLAGAAGYGCSEEVTALRVVITFSNTQLDQVALSGVVGGQFRFQGKRFPVPSRPLRSGDDVVIRNFPDSDDGKTLALSVHGMGKAEGQGSRTAQVIIRKGALVNATVHFGSKISDAGTYPNLPPREDGMAPREDGMATDKGCTVGTSTCDGKNILTCLAGEAGPVVAVKSCPLGCVPVQCRSLVPSNNLPTSLLGGSTVKWAPKAKLVTINTNTGTISDGTKAPHVFVKQAQPGPQIKALSFKSIFIPSGTTLQVTGDNALALVASGTIDVQGTIDASGKMNQPGPGGGQGGTFYTKAGGQAGGGNGCEKKIGLFGLYTLGGGAGGSHAGTGGTGGAGSLDTHSCPGGLPLNSYGSGDLVPLTAGSGGGRGGGGTPLAIAVGGGGGGGGAAMLVSGTAIIVGASTGVGGGVNVGGGGGGASVMTYRSGGGGGSGGGLLLEAPVVIINAGATLAANGGGGGGGSGNNFGAIWGKNGGLKQSQTQAGNPSAGGGTGGPGSGGSALNGGNGGGDLAGGGAGGAAGYIRVNTFTGIAVVEGVVSGDFRQGKVSVSP